jgi:hypothetical protein
VQRRREVVPGAQSPHDDFEEIVAEVMHQEQLDRTIRRLDAEIDRDEFQARTRAAKTQAAARKPTTTSSPNRKPRPRSPRPRLRPKGAGEDSEQGHHARAPHAGILIIAITAFWLTIAGGAFNLVAKVVRLLT